MFSLDFILFVFWKSRENCNGFGLSVRCVNLLSANCQNQDWWDYRIVKGHDGAGTLASPFQGVLTDFSGDRQLACIRDGTSVSGLQYVV